MKLLTLSLLLSLAAVLVSAADPTCSSGIRQGDACCPAICGQCGGTGCYRKSLDLGTRCCSSGILNPAFDVPSCTVSDAPCIISSAPAPASDPTCATGVSSRQGACCIAACGTCGGNGCGQRSRSAGSRCCNGGILNPSNNLPSCDTSLPPCILNRQPSTPSPTSSPSRRPIPSASPSSAPSSPFSSFDGQWSTAVVNGNRQLVARHEACAVMVDGKVVLIGGRGRKPVSVYDPVTRTWETKSRFDQITQIHHFQCVAYNGAVYIPTSWNMGFPNETNNPVGFKYVVATDTWSTFATLPEPRRRGGAASVLIGSRIYVLAGNRGGHGDQATSLPWVDMYDIDNDEWTEKALPDIPEPGRDHTGAAVLKNGDICVASGRNGGSAGFFSLNFAETWCYSFAQGSWSRKQDMPSPRAGAMVGTTCEGHMMVAGGEAAPGGRGTGRAYKRVDVFDGEKWTRAPDFVQARHGSGLAFANCNSCGHIFVPSGSGNIGGSPELLTMEEYIPDNAQANCAQY